MVNYKTRIFFEPDTNSLGADVIIYSDAGDKIDTILITSESKYNELYEQIRDIDLKYIDKEDLAQELLNVQNTLEINATTIMGYGIENISLNGHTHSELAPKNHASNSKGYGVGSTGNYGHVKTVNNLNSSQYIEGEALSAYQGVILQEAINQAKSEILKWEKITLSGHNNVASYCTLYVNQALRIANIVYKRDGLKKGVGSVQDANGRDKNPSPYWVVGETTTGCIYLHKEGAIPLEYTPPTSTSQTLYRGDFSFRVLADGSICIHNVSGKGSKNGDGINVHNNILYHY